MGLVGVGVSFELSTDWMGKSPAPERERPGRVNGRAPPERSLGFRVGWRSAGSLILSWSCRQLGPVAGRFLPARSAAEAVPEETVHEPGHRDAMTLRLMEQRRDDGSRDDGHVVGRVWHQLSMPQGGGLLLVASCCASRIQRSCSDHDRTSGLTTAGVY